MTKTEDPKVDATQPAIAAILPRQIVPGSIVLCSNDRQVGLVDHMQGPITVKLQKDAAGVHHYVPLGWVKKVDVGVNVVRLDRPHDKVESEWSSQPPAR